MCRDHSPHEPHMPSLWRVCVTVVIVFLSLWRPAHCQCTGNNNLSRGMCGAAADPIANDTACDPNTIACDFSHNLCCLRQGCKDAAMAPWVGTGGTATAQQSKSPCGNAETYSVLESPWVHFTTDTCVTFTFSRYSPMDLDVFLAEHSGRVHTVVNRTEAKHQDGTNYTTHLQVSRLTTKLKFRVYGGGATNGSTPLKLFPVTARPGPCDVPEGTYVDQVVITGSPPTAADGQTTPVSPTICPRTRTTREGDSDSNVGVIAGAAAGAVVVVVAVVVVAVIFWRRRHRRPSDGKTAKETELANVVQKDKKSTKSNHSGVRNTPVFNALYTGSYSNIDGVTSRTDVTPSDEDLDPYDRPADDGVPGKTRDTTAHSHTDDREAAASGIAGAAADLYRQVNKPKKKALQPDPSQLYSQVQKNGGSPVQHSTAHQVYGVDKSPSPSPLQQEDGDYSSLQHHRATNHIGEASQDFADDPYDRPGESVYSLAKDTSGNAAHSDEYNTLNFGNPRKMADGSGARGATPKAYDHVMTVPEDDYSTANVGTRHVVNVIDSDYDSFVN